MLRTVGLSGGVVEAGGERKELLDGCLLSLGLILLLNALLEDIVLLDLLVEHDSDLIDLMFEVLVLLRDRIDVTF